MTDSKQKVKELQDAKDAIIPRESLGAIDQILGRVISRKFFVFLTAIVHSLQIRSN